MTDKRALSILLCLAACGEPAPTDRACEGCFSREVAATLSFANAPSLPDIGGSAAMAPGGDRFAFVPESTPYQVLLFDGDGAFEATVGTRGDGPGEFQRIRIVRFDEHGRLWVVSRDGRRLDIFESDLALASSESVREPIVHMGPVTGGMAAAVATAEGGRIGLLSPSGEVGELWSGTSDAEMNPVACLPSQPTDAGGSSLRKRTPIACGRSISRVPHVPSSTTNQTGSPHDFGPR